MIVRRHSRAVMARGALLVLAALATLGSARASEPPRLASALADHAVLQRDRPIVIEGSAAPGARLTVTLGDQTAVAVTDASGRWRATLPARAATADPLTLRVRDAAGQSAEARDLLIGDVWLCSGQSNMELQVVRALDSYNQIAAAGDGALRLATVPRMTAATPLDHLPSPLAWAAAAPASVSDFSAVCYYMARALRTRTKVPIGAIAASWGGTPIKSWLDPVAVAGVVGPRAPSAPTADPTGQTSQTGLLYNGMIAPLGAFGLSGIAWYQGESDVGHPGYRDRLAAMIGGWRRQFGRPDLPLLVVGLANYGKMPTDPDDSATAALREEQRQFVLHDAHSALITTIDLGERGDVHPADKQQVGRRLSRAAVAALLGNSGVQGPSPTRAYRRNGAIRVDFAQVTGALHAWSASDALAFELCGPVGTACRFARATAQGSTVTIIDDAGPVSRVRYAWADSPIVNLYDDNALPPAPFEIAVAP